MSVIIRLQKLPWTANAIDIRRFFYGMSIPDGGVHIIGGDLGDAFIAFSTDEDARKAMQLTGSRLNEAHVTLQLSSKSEMQEVIAAARGGTAPKVAVSALPVTSSYPAAEMPPDSYRDHRDGAPPGFGQQAHHAATAGHPGDGRMQRPLDGQSMFTNSSGMPMMPDFLQPPPQPFFQEREMRGQPDSHRPDFGRHAQPMQHDGPRFGEDLERRDINRGLDQLPFDRRHGGPPERPDFDRRHGGDARMVDMEGQRAWDHPQYHIDKGERGGEHGKNILVGDSGSKQRHDVTSSGPGEKSGYGSGTRTMDRNIPGFPRDINYDRIDPSKYSVSAPNRRDAPRGVNEGRAGRDPAGFLKDTPRFPEGASVLDTDGRTLARGPHSEQGGEFGRKMPVNDATMPRFSRGEGMRRDDRLFDGPGREQVPGGPRLPVNPSRNAFPCGLNVAPGTVGPEGETVVHDRGRLAPLMSKDVAFPSGPGSMQGPPGSNSSKRMEFDALPREMQQQPGMQPRELLGFGRGRPIGDMPKYKDGEMNVFEGDMNSARNGTRFDRGGPPKDIDRPGAGMGGRGPDFGRNVPPISGEMMPGFPKGSPQGGRGRMPMNPEGHGVGRGGSIRDLGRPDMFQDGHMTDGEMPGAGRGGPQRDINAPGFGRGILGRAPEMPGFSRGAMSREGELPGRGGVPRDSEMPGFGRGGPGRDTKPTFGRWGPSGEPAQSKDGVLFEVEMSGFGTGGPPNEFGRHGFGRGGPPMDMAMRPPRDVERPGFNRSGQRMDLDNRGRDVERPEMDRGPIGTEKQGFGRGGPRVDMGGLDNSAGPGFERRGPRMDMGGLSGYIDRPGFHGMGGDGPPRDSDESRIGGRPPMNMDQPGFRMGGPQHDNDRRGFGQRGHDIENDGGLFIEERDGPHEGATPGRPEGAQFRQGPWDRPLRNEQPFHRDDVQRRDEGIHLGPDHDGRSRQNARPLMKQGLLGDAPGDVVVDSRGVNQAPSIPNLFDEPMMEGWHPGAADERARHRSSARIERDYDRKDSSPRGPPSQSTSHHDEEFRRHDRKRSRGGGDADTCCVHVSGLPRALNYRDIRRLFRGSDIPRDGLKVTNDRRGQRVGECFIRFFAPSHAEAALRRDGAVVEGRSFRVRTCSEYDFDKATDSYMPGSSDDHGSRSSTKRPRSRSPATRQHTDSDTPDAFLAVKNLPHKVTRADLKKFFGALRLVDDSVHIENHKETSTAYVQIASRRDYPAALDLHKRTFNSRVIDIFPISSREFQSQVAGLKGVEAGNDDDAAAKMEAKPDVKKHVNLAANNGVAGPTVEQQRKPPAPAKQPPAPSTNTACVKMNGLPSAANGPMVKEFYVGLQLATRGINIIYNPDQTATGVAFVEFATTADCQKAFTKNRTPMGESRCVAIEPIDKHEMQMQMAVEKARCRVPLAEEKKAPPLSSIVPSHTIPEPPRPAFAVLVRNTPYRITEVELHTVFQCCRPIPGSVKIQRASNGKPTGDALVAFHNPIDARRAVTELNGRFVMGRTLMLSLV